MNLLHVNEPLVSLNVVVFHVILLLKYKLEKNINLIHVYIQLL